MGFYLTGGGDIAIERFDGEPNSRISDVDPDRDRMEIEITQYAFEENIPLFGICRGIQVINVTMGGSLFTDINSQKRKLH